jgi:hypothetical protein
MVENTRGVPPVKETSRNLSSLWDAKEFSESAETPLSLIHTHTISLSLLPCTHSQTINKKTAANNFHVFLYIKCCYYI